MPWLTVKIRVKTDGVRKGGAGGTVTRLCVVTTSIATARTVAAFTYQYTRSYMAEK